jgi:hypothetical protein
MRADTSRDRWDASDLCSFISGHLDKSYASIRAYKMLLVHGDAGAPSNYSYPDAVRFSARLPSAPMRARRHEKIFASTASIQCPTDSQGTEK